MYNIQLFGFAIKKAVWQKENNCIYAFDKLEKQPFKKKDQSKCHFQLAEKCCSKFYYSFL